ncbi:FAR1 DNA binding domain-containing protein [Artemisia annua]|uniref:FAR1 DNA binding domain-containing protein n=1 Tax=Artemisia annua TaxID=35608 RepID=A0A2U1L2P9_ARTAN|nr:FAR1 DNA binding domain-containing protein [Artemisia annua]
MDQTTYVIRYLKKPPSSRRIHQQLTGKHHESDGFINKTATAAGISIIRSDSSTNPSESSINPLDSSINPPEKAAAATPVIPINRKTQPPYNITENQQLINDIDENHLIEVPEDDLVTEGDLPEDEDEDATVQEVHDSMKSPKPTLYEHTETPGGSVYWKPHVDEGITVPEEGKYYDTIEEAIDMYSNYAEVGGFQIKKAGQKITKSGIVKLKYLMCNKEGAPRHVSIDTLDAKHSDK